MYVAVATLPLRAAPALYKESWILDLELRAGKRAGQRKMPSKV